MSLRPLSRGSNPTATRCSAPTPAEDTRRRTALTATDQKEAVARTYQKPPLNPVGAKRRYRIPLLIWDCRASTSGYLSKIFSPPTARLDRKSVVWGRSASVRVEHGGRR